MRALITTVFLSSATATLAESPMSGAAFEAYSEGRTLFFLDGDQAYGAEQYLPGRRVIWSFLNGECQNGYWYEASEAICFVYENMPSDPQCWQFHRTSTGISAQFQGESPSTALIGVLRDSDPLVCPGPKVGV